MIEWIHSFSLSFKSLFIMVLPYFILGVGTGAWIESKTNFSWVNRWITNDKTAIFLGSLLGAILPGCACATMPMAQGLLRKGASLSATTAFVMTSPLLAPQTIVLTFALLGPSFGMARIAFGFLGGIGIGYIIRYLDHRHWVTAPSLTDAPDCCAHSPDPAPRFWRSFWTIGRQLGIYFIIGIGIASALTITLPVTVIPTFIETYPMVTYLVAALIGIPVYICEGEEIPITYSLIALGLADGPALTFLLGAVGTCIPTLLFARKILGQRTMLVYAAYWVVFAPVAGIIFSLLS
jgi:uncharacterized membrane protein YraQ (UPF0718 family)